MSTNRTELWGSFSGKVILGLSLFIVIAYFLYYPKYKQYGAEATIRVGCIRLLHVFAGRPLFIMTLSSVRFETL